MKLSFFNPQGEKTSREFDNTFFIIGRDPECDFVISNETVSARHASVSKINGNFMLSDLNSTNGTLVNGVLVAKQTIFPEDLLQFGSFQCWWDKSVPLQVAEPASAAAAPSRKRFPVIRGGAKPGGFLKEQTAPTFNPKQLQSLEHSVCAMTENAIIRTYRRNKSSYSIQMEKPEVRECFESGKPYFFIYSIAESNLKKKKGDHQQAQPLSQLPSSKRKLESLTKNAISLRVAFPVSCSTFPADAVLYLELLKPSTVTSRLLKQITKHILEFTAQLQPV